MTSLPVIQDAACSVPAALGGQLCQDREVPSDAEGLRDGLSAVKGMVLRQRHRVPAGCC
jgi:hypothetical protein